MHINIFQVLYQNKYNINNNLEIEMISLFPPFLFLSGLPRTLNIKVEIS